MEDLNNTLSAIADGDKAAFEMLYQALSERVYNTALSYSHDVQQAEEITQDVFVKVYRNAAKFQGEAAVATWVYRITVNTALNHMKQRQRRGLFSEVSREDERPDFVHPGVLLEQKEKSIQLFKVIDTLSDNQKTAFILSYIEDLPRQEVADVMEMSLKAIESLLQRAKLNLRKKLS